MNNPAEKKFSALYEKERKKVDSILNKALANREPASLYSPGAYILKSGGKRLRPLLVLFSAKAVGNNKKFPYNAAAAVELLHNFTLVHDDIMDNADKRRGLLTIHKKYDINTAILAGDSLLSVAYEYLLKDCNGNTKSVLASFTKGLVEVCEGQSLDKDYETRKNVGIDDYILMIKKKTAAMFEMCCALGAELSNGSKEEIKALKNFGRNIGIAFQVQDDLLDLTGDETKFGKKVGGDLMEGKKTFLFIRALEKSRGSDRKKLLKVIERKGIRANQVNSYKQLYKKLNIIEDAENEIKIYTGKALRTLKNLKKEEDRLMFEWLANSLINRVK